MVSWSSKFMISDIFEELGLYILKNGQKIGWEEYQGSKQKMKYNSHISQNNYIYYYSFQATSISLDSLQVYSSSELCPHEIQWFSSIKLYDKLLQAPPH